MNQNTTKYPCANSSTQTHLSGKTLHALSRFISNLFYIVANAKFFPCILEKCYGSVGNCRSSVWAWDW